VPTRIAFEVRPTVGRPEELVGRAAFVRVGDAPLRVPRMQLESASLALQIIDGDGRPVPLPPPPIPDPAAAPVELGPGDSYDVEYRGFLPSWIAPGSYRVRARLAGDEPATSQWVDVTVTD
jgi:hypothetical protein